MLLRMLRYMYSEQPVNVCVRLGFFLGSSTPVPLALSFQQQERIYRGTLFSFFILFRYLISASLLQCHTVRMASQVGFLTAQQTLQEQQLTCGAPLSSSFLQFNYCSRSARLIIPLRSHFPLTCFNYTLHVPLRERLIAAK